jgi:hypothetical protein
VNALAPTAGNISTGIDIYGAWVANAEEDAQDAAQAYAAVANDIGVVGAVLVAGNKTMWSNIWWNLQHQEPIKPPSDPDPRSGWEEEEEEEEVDG